MVQTRAELARLARKRGDQIEDLDARLVQKANGSIRAGASSLLAMPMFVSEYLFK
jgi:hypothetical protein